MYKRQAPEIEDVSVSLVDGSLDVAAKDNEYVSVVALYDAAGSKALTYVAPNQETAGETQHVRLDVSKVVGKTFLLQVYDYAMNVSTYKVSYDFLPDIDGYYTFFDLNKKQWYTYTEDGSESAAMGATNLKLYAAEYADGYVFAIDEKNALYVMPDNDFANVTKIADLGAASGPLSYDFFVSDMAYNAAEKEMYFLAYSEANELGASYLFKLDLLTGATCSSARWARTSGRWPPTAPMASMARARSTTSSITSRLPRSQSRRISAHWMTSCPSTWRSPRWHGMPRTRSSSSRWRLRRASRARSLSLIHI